MRDLLRFALITALGLLIFVALDAVTTASLTPAAPHQLPQWWQSLLYGALLALQLVMPPFVAGWLAKRHGWLIGAIVGGLAEPVLAILVLGLSIHGPVATVLFTNTIRSTIVGLVAGGAGASIRRQPSNNSFKPNPLRSFKTPSGSSGGSA
jgi:MFS family permease